MEAQDAIDLTLRKSPTFDPKKVTSLVIFKAQIFLRMGYLEVAYDLFSRIQLLILNDRSGKTNNFDAVQHLPFTEAVDYLECSLGIISIDIEQSRDYEAIQSNLDRCEAIVKTLYRSKDCELLRKIKIQRLVLARDLLDFNKRNQIADELGAIYQGYDHYRLIRCEDFMQFVKERVMYLMDDCKHDISLLRVENILSILDPKKNEYWHLQYRILQADCFTNMRRASEGYDILQEILHQKILTRDANKLKDHRLFVEVHIALSTLRSPRQQLLHSRGLQKLPQVPQVHHSGVPQEPRPVQKTQLRKVAPPRDSLPRRRQRRAKAVRLQRSAAPPQE